MSSWDVSCPFWVVLCLSGKDQKSDIKKWLLRDWSWLDDCRFRVFGRISTTFSTKMSGITPSSTFGGLYFGKNTDAHVSANLRSVLSTSPKYRIERTHHDDEYIDSHSSADNVSHKKTNMITNKNPEIKKEYVRLHGDEKRKMNKAEHLHNYRWSSQFEHTQRRCHLSYYFRGKYIWSQIWSNVRTFFNKSIWSLQKSFTKRNSM